MSKLTKEQVDEIIKLYSEGITKVELAARFGVSQPTITYWTNPESRKKSILTSITNFKLKTPEEKRAKTQSRKEYLRIYMANRYKNDVAFRNKQVERQREYTRSKRSARIKLNSI